MSNVDRDGKNTLQIKAIGVVIATFETLPRRRIALLLVLLPNQTTAILRWSDTATRHHPDLSLHLRMAATGLESGGMHRGAAASVRLRGRPTHA